MVISNHPRKLDERTEVFAERIRVFLRSLPQSYCNSDSKQLERSSGSIAANYLEAINGLSKKDFLMRLRIARKESRESVLWLRLLHVPDGKNFEKLALLQEARELTYILTAAIKTTESTIK